ncbi:transposase [Citrobacter cronae]|nr:transposase [Citrobacter cronae]
MHELHSDSSAAAGRLRNLQAIGMAAAALPQSSRDATMASSSISQESIAMGRTTYTPQQRQQVLILGKEPGATAASVARQTGIPARTVREWFANAEKEEQQPDNVTSLMEQRERAQQLLNETPSAKIRQLRNHFTAQQFELLQQHAKDLTGLRARQLKAVVDNDPQMTRAVASAILALLKAQEAERLMYDIKPGTEADIMRGGMNRQK